MEQGKRLLILFIFSIIICLFTTFSHGIPLKSQSILFKNDTCNICPAGTFSENDKILNCSAFCPLGSCPSNLNCSLCPIGTANFFPNASACSPCNDGWVSHVEGALNCTACDPAMTSNTQKSKCVPCPAGYHNLHKGSTCEKCRPGEYSAQRSEKCSRCPKGSYNPSYAQGSCIACGRGYYNPSVGQRDFTACFKCPAGFYCPLELNAEPITCPKNHYCKDGTSKPQLCSKFMEADEGSEVCHPTTQLYLLALAGIATVVLLIFVIVFCRSRSGTNGNDQSKSALQSAESDRLIPPPLDGPVYAGL